MKIFNFTKTSILTLAKPKVGRVYYKDIKEKGLALYITANGTITFFVRKRIHGKDERIILGNFPEITVEQARSKTLIAKAKIANGSNPIEDKNKLRDEATFREFFDQFMERYSKKQKKSWKYDEREVNKFLTHWFKKKASLIIKQEVRLLHEKIREQNGLYQANRILERIRAIYNKNIEWGWNGVNPTIGIKKFKEKSRDRFIQPDELPRFFEALNEELNSTIRDYIWVSLLTGARKGNVLAMRWNEINFARKEWRIPDTKNGEALTIPLSDQVIEFLENRDQASEFVFPSRLSSKGYLQDPKKAWARILKKLASTISGFTIYVGLLVVGKLQPAAASLLLASLLDINHQKQLKYTQDLI
jgi:integrase